MPRANSAAISCLRCSGVIFSSGVWFTSIIGIASRFSNSLDGEIMPPGLQEGDEGVASE
jgi:hypothetical protein